MTNDYFQSSSLLSHKQVFVSQNNKTNHLQSYDSSPEFELLFLSDHSF